MKYTEMLNRTDSTEVYKKARIRDISRKTGKCGVCPMNGGCNAKHKFSRSWKNQTKFRKQWMKRFSLF
jgi:hypothetical protein